MGAGVCGSRDATASSCHLQEPVFLHEGMSDRGDRVGFHASLFPWVTGCRFKDILVLWSPYARESYLPPLIMTQSSHKGNSLHLGPPKNLQLIHVPRTGSLLF